MAEFSITDIGFTGFRIVRERPRIVLFWAGAHLLVSLVIRLTLGPTLVHFLFQLKSPSVSPGEDPTKALAILQPAASAIIAVLAVSLLLNALIAAAMNRAVLRPDEDRFGYLRLGMDELRQLGLLGLYLALWFLALILICAAATLLGTIAGGSPEALVGVAMGASLVVGVALAVRLSLASALTFDSGRIDLAAALRLTQGRFWPLLRAYLVAAGMAVCVLVLGNVVITCVAAAVAGGLEPLNRLVEADNGSALDLLQPARIVQFVLTSIVTVLAWPIWMTPAPAVYRRLTADVRVLA